MSAIKPKITEYSNEQKNITHNEKKKTVKTNPKLAQMWAFTGKYIKIIINYNLYVQKLSRDMEYTNKT